jgi:polyphosphate kinase
VGVAAARGSAGPHREYRVRSIIGRFLEHSRIFYFANGSENPEQGDYFIGSPDWMFRNLSKRIEVATPILAKGPKERLWEILDICLRDERQAWVLGPDAKYVQLHPREGGVVPRLLELTRHSWI